MRLGIFGVVTVLIAAGAIAVVLDRSSGRRETLDVSGPATGPQPPGPPPRPAPAARNDAKTSLEFASGPAPEPPPADRPDPFALVETEPAWEAIAEETFAEGAPRQVRFRVRDENARSYVAGNEWRIQGVAEGRNWPGAYCTLPVTRDTGKKVELAADFRLGETAGQVFVGLSAGTDNRKAGRLPFYVYFSGRPESGRYSAHTRHIELPVTLDPERPSTRGFGDESSRFRTLRAVYDRERSEILYEVDRRRIGLARIEGALGAVTEMRIHVTSSVAGSRLDVRVGSLRARIWGDTFLEELVALENVEWKRRDPVEKRLVWYFDAEGLALADIDEKKTLRFRDVMGISSLRITGMAFGPRSVWIGTPQGLLAWDRDRRFWYRLAVGACMVDANVERLWQDEGKLYVMARSEEGAAGTFEFDSETSKWRRW